MNNGKRRVNAFSKHADYVQHIVKEYAGCVRHTFKKRKIFK